MQTIIIITSIITIIIKILYIYKVLHCFKIIPYYFYLSHSVFIRGTVLHVILPHFTDKAIQTKRRLSDLPQVIGIEIKPHARHTQTLLWLTSIPMRS